MKSTLIKILFVLLSVSVSSCGIFKKAKKKKAPITRSKPKPRPKKGAIQPYSKIITKDAKSDTGLFTVHKIDENYFYEIPDTLLGREMLMVTRISKTASGIGFGGGKQNQQVLRWERKDKKLLLRVVSHSVVASDSLPVHEAVVNSNFEPILYTFPIKALSKDSLGTVIDVTNLFAKDVKALGMQKYYRKKYKAFRMEGDKSFIENIKSYPLNIEARHVKTYSSSVAPSNSSTGTISIEINNSMILLPKTPMKRRFYDKRVGWFSRGQTDYGLDAQESKRVRFLDRWRLEVKEEDLEKFKNGELVEPKKPIVYYIDRATPKKWRKYLKQGIEDWQVAFEEAGFKNAIIAKDPPSKEEDPEWSPEDIRYSVIRYLASPIPNANGPHVSDPRSGEILESDINWYHNVMSLLKGWFFVQTAAINPDARLPEFKEEIMGELIRFVSAHEVGHTLGLPHNMGSSAAYKVEDLRNPEFTKKFGTAPSIMDYARFNYIAQPEDKGVALMPNIGVYDKYAIAWGYKPILNKSETEEKPILDSWILKHAGNPLYRYGRQQGRIVDPSSQTEDLGDDAMLASHYGILNLKRIVPNLIEWTSQLGEDYSDLNEMYGHVLSQFNRYMGHVVNNIGGVYEDYKTSDQEGAVYTYVDKKKQKRALKFLDKHLFSTPKWLIDPNIFNKIKSYGSVERIQRIQVSGLNYVLSVDRINRMIENETLHNKKAYSATNLMNDVRNTVWKELKSGRKIDTYKRNLQRAHIEKLKSLLSQKSDVSAIARAELNTLKKSIKRSIGRSADNMTKIHLKDILEKIELILDPK